MFNTINEDALIIDVRDKKEHENSSELIIKNSINIPYNKIEEEIQKMNIEKDRQIIVFCASGNRSKIAYIILKELGYTNVFNFGGYNNIDFLL